MTARADYPSLTFVESSGGWVAEQGDLAAAGSTACSALHHLARKHNPDHVTPEDLCHWCDGAGDFRIGVRDVGNGWSRRMTHPLYPLRIECSYCEGTGYAPDGREAAAIAEREEREAWETDRACESVEVAS